MPESMPTAATFFVLIMASGITFADDKVIECVGISNDQSMSAPSDVEKLVRRSQPGSQQYVVGVNYIVASGVGQSKDERFELCETTAGQYRYSSNCDIKNQRQFVTDWLLEKNIDLKTSPFFHKYESALGGRFIGLNRTNLSIIDEDYSLNTRVNVENVNGKRLAIPHNYVIVYGFSASCKLQKSKV